METPAWKILLVEDDEDDHALMRETVGEIGAGCHLEWVRTFDDALAELARHPYDACLCDYWLGAHTGLELIEQARAAGGTTTMILLTGVGDRLLDLEAMRAGVDDYLEKGRIDAARLERAIRYALERRTRARDLASAHDTVTDFADFLRTDLQAPLATVGDALSRLCDRLEHDPDLAAAREAAAAMKHRIDDLAAAARAAARE